MQIEGPIEEIIFRNEQNGYTVFVIDFKTTPVVCVGKLINANIGENLSLEGEYVNNSKYGYQFSFNSYEVVLPTTLSGIEKYLSSGLIKGVGPITAKNIVKHFGKQTFDIIEMSPSSLAEVKNISMKKALEIGDKFNELKKLQNSVMFLQKYNITTNMALKIYDVYGAKTIDIVKNNPYRLVEEIDSCPFLLRMYVEPPLGLHPRSPFVASRGDMRRDRFPWHVCVCQHLRDIHVLRVRDTRQHCMVDHKRAVLFPQLLNCTTHFSECTHKGISMKNSDDDKLGREICVDGRDKFHVFVF